LAPEEEQCECFFRAHGDDAAVVEPDAFNDQAEEFALGVGVFFDAPEDPEVVESVNSR
jgi:hypothetical protein